jgi:hypothetical protein
MDILLRGYLPMRWEVKFHHDFEPEYSELSEPVQDELLAGMALLREFGPKLGRPHADTLSGSKHANLKELRFKAGGGVWRVVYAFDPNREGIVLLAGDKAGVGEKRFYKQLIAKSEKRYGAHLASIGEYGRK